MGDREGNLRSALNKLSNIGEVRRTSPIYETTPVGYADQGMFLNAVAEVTTELPPEQIVRCLLKIERKLGRVRADDRNGPRLIDLDLLLLQDVVATGVAAEVPHPRMVQRRFVLQPLSDLAPDLIHPIARRSIRDLLAGLDSAEVVRLFTRER